MDYLSQVRYWYKLHQLRSFPEDAIHIDVGENTVHYVNNIFSSSIQVSTKRFRF